MVGHWINTTNILEFEMKPLVNDLTVSLFGHDMLKKRMTVGKLLRILDNMELLDIGEEAEKAVSAEAKVELCKKNTKGIDTVNGVQIKHVKSRPEPNVTGIRASVSPQSSRGPLAVVVTETITDKQYYFWIPLREAHKANCIKITFNADGSPRKGKGRCDSYLPDWWKFQVTNWTQLNELVSKFKA
jgi:hypothetical protein